MNTSRAFLLIMVLTSVAITSCDKDQEAEDASPEQPALNGGNGGGGGGGGVSLINPDSIGIDDEPIFACNGSGTNFVMHDSTSFAFAQLLTNPLTVTSCAFLDSDGDPYSMTIQLYGMTIAGTDATQAEMDAFFVPGTRNYILTPGTTPGVLLSIWRDSSDPGQAFQTNIHAQPASSSFTITDVHGFMDGGFYKVRVRATFKCQMWSVLGSTTMQCVDGIFVGDFTSQGL